MESDSEVSPNRKNVRLARVLILVLMESDSEIITIKCMFMHTFVLILVLMESDSESYLRKKPITAGFIVISHFTFLYTKYPKFAYIVRK